MVRFAAPPSIAGMCSNCGHVNFIQEPSRQEMQFEWLIDNCHIWSMHETLLASLRTDPIFYCRLRGSEGFRQQLLRRKGKLVLLTPHRAGAGVQEVADYLKPILTTAAGSSLDVYRI